MRLLLFAGLGMVLGYLYFSWVRRSAGSLSASHQAPGGHAIAEMAVRVAVFALVLGLLLYRFGPLAGIAALAGVGLARGWMARSELDLGRR